MLPDRNIPAPPPLPCATLCPQVDDILAGMPFHPDPMTSLCSSVASSQLDLEADRQAVRPSPAEDATGDPLSTSRSVEVASVQPESSCYDSVAHDSTRCLQDRRSSSRRSSSVEVGTDPQASVEVGTDPHVVEASANPLPGLSMAETCLVQGRWWWWWGGWGAGDNHRRSPPPPPWAPFSTDQSDHRGKKRSLQFRENVIGPFLVHKLLGPRTLPPPPPSLLMLAQRGGGGY